MSHLSSHGNRSDTRAGVSLAHLFRQRRLHLEGFYHNSTSTRLRHHENTKAESLTHTDISIYPTYYSNSSLDPYSFSNHAPPPHHRDPRPHQSRSRRRPFHQRHHSHPLHFRQKSTRHEEALRQLRRSVAALPQTHLHWPPPQNHPGTRTAPPLIPRRAARCLH